MRVIITGGTGLIGQALSSAIVKDGHDVFVLSRAPQRAHHLSPQVNVVQWDAQTANGWGCLINSETCIVNLAGENLSAGRWTTERKRRILESV